MNEIASPCIKICILDRQSGLCIGCLRSGEEIASWVAMGDAARARVMAELPARAGRVPAGAAARAKRRAVDPR